MAVADFFERPQRMGAIKPVALRPAADGRMGWVDAAKGGAILLVVIGHAWRGIGARDLIPEPLFSAVDARIYAVHMPVFFALSGLFFASLLARSTAGAFTQSRLRRLFWPMVIWTYLFLGLKRLAGEAVNTPVAMSDLLIWPVPGHLHLWFLWALLVLHMGFLLTRPLLRDGQYPLPVLALFALITSAIAVLPVPLAIDYWIGGARHYAPFFVLGMMFGAAGRLSDIRPRTGILSAVLAIGLFAAWPGLSGTPSTDLLLRLLLSAAFIIAFAGLCARFPATHWLSLLGVASMAIYLGHTLFSATVREALLFFGETNWALHLMFGTLAGLVGPLLLLWVARRTGTARLLGLDVKNWPASLGGSTVCHKATKRVEKPL